MKDAEYLIAQNELLPTERPPSSIVKWAEERRILPPNTPWPGPYKYSRTPYQREICENLAPYSPIINTVICKCRKVGLTTCIENVIAYWAFAWPADQIYSTATESLAKQWATETFLALVESMGYRDRLVAQFSNGRNKRAAATAKRIEYSGGHIDIISSGSIDARRQKNARLILLDEVDGVKEQTTTGEGSYIDILKGHSYSWGNRRKFCAFSSPTTFESSAIWGMYSEYDCRKFLIPCPVCGRLIELKESNGEANYGLKAETKGGEIINVYYQCEHCGDPIWNEDKAVFYSDNPHCRKDPQKKLDPAHWEPTKKISDPYSRSYSINALYSPLGALTFRDMYEAKKKAEAEGPDAMRSYVNLYAGLPFRDIGSRPKIDTVLNLRMEYKSGEVPADVLFLVLAMDVQRGSETDEKNPARLECEVLGIAKGHKSYSILYKRIEGPTDDPYSGAWTLFNDWYANEASLFTRTDGAILSVAIIGIDCGDQPETVFRYCEQFPACYPVKGFGDIYANEKKREKGDLPGGLKRYRAVKFGSSDTHVLEVNTPYYKNQLYSRLKIERQPQEPQKNGFCGFPRDYPDSYFTSLTAEEKRIDGSFHKVHARNEALDIRVYACAISDFYLEGQVTAWRAYYQAQGYSAIRLSAINTLWVLDAIARNPNHCFPAGSNRP